MTFEDYINNPMGRKNSVFSHREMYKELYSKKLDVIMVREKGRAKYNLYSNGDSEYFVHMKVPSEVVPNFYYDAVVRFFTKDKTITMSRNLNKYNVEFYSNDPAFVFTFAHSFLKNGLFIKDLVPRMSKEAVKKVAKERNPSNEVGYVKSLYFTYLLMKKYGLFNKISFETYAEKYNKKALLGDVVHADIKIEQRQIEGDKVAKEKRNKKLKEKKTRTQSSTDRPSVSVARSSNISRSIKSRTAKYSNTSKRTKRI